MADGLRAAGWHVEVHLDHFAEDAADVDWIPEVARRGWVILTKDKAIRRTTDERSAVMEHTVRMFTLAGGNMTGADMLRLVLDNGLGIGRALHKTAPPFLAVIARTGVTVVGTC